MDKERGKEHPQTMGESLKVLSKRKPVICLCMCVKCMAGNHDACCGPQCNHHIHIRNR